MPDVLQRNSRSGFTNSDLTRLGCSASRITRGVELTRGLANTPWDSREFVVKDCDGRLLAFGAGPE
jgi:hypothetical protein